MVDFSMQNCKNDKKSKGHRVNQFQPNSPFDCKALTKYKHDVRLQNFHENQPRTSVEGFCGVQFLIRSANGKDF